MWQVFKDDIGNCEPFKSREDYESWVRAWVEDSINECGRVERFALRLTDEEADEELNAKIGEDNG